MPRGQLTGRLMDRWDPSSVERLLRVAALIEAESGTVTAEKLLADRRVRSGFSGMTKADAAEVIANLQGSDAQQEIARRRGSLRANYTVAREAKDQTAQAKSIERNLARAEARAQKEAAKGRLVAKETSLRKKAGKERLLREVVAAERGATGKIPVDRTVPAEPQQVPRGIMRRDNAIRVGEKVQKGVVRALGQGAKRGVLARGAGLAARVGARVASAPILGPAAVGLLAYEAADTATDWITGKSLSKRLFGDSEAAVRRAGQLERLGADFDEDAALRRFEADDAAVGQQVRMAEQFAGRQDDLATIIQNRQGELAQASVASTPSIEELALILGLRV